MASPFQRQAFHRKLIYAALILGLFTVALGWRKGELKLLGMDVKGVDAQARDLSIREQSRGEVDLLGALVRLSTMGLRGVATCYEWINAMDSQKKNQWNELELHVRTLTKLQPHFITPWLFQSWNLAYNVSVESDRIRDKYFYISRGIGLLAQGERQNRDNPDMRWSIGFFMQHKICQSDETNVLRSLSQLSMIPPNERDPGRFWKSDGERLEINLNELEDFCKGHPQLVRRLREGMRRERRSEQLRQFRCERVEDLVQFLEDNLRVPSLWEDTKEFDRGAWKAKEDKEKPLAERFPVLPPRPEARRAEARPWQQPPDETALHDESRLLDEHDAYQVARAWYGYAQEPLPKPANLPGQNEPIENRVYQRIPQHMATVIFRDYPAQAQRFTAERLQDEGWFDNTGWTLPDDWFPGERFSNGDPAVVGANPEGWGKKSWGLAERLWERFGKDNHLLPSAVEEKNLEQRAKSLAKKKNLQEGYPPPAMRDEDMDEETRQEYFAWAFLYWLAQTKHLCNFEFHYNRAKVEAQEETIIARKTFTEALDAQRLRNDEPEALRKYLSPTGLKAWRRVLLSNKTFRGDSLMQEQTFEYQLRFVDLYSRLGGATFKAQVTGMLLLPSLSGPGSGAVPLGLANWVPTLLEKKEDNPPQVGQPQKNGSDKQGQAFIMNWDNPLLGGPFDGDDDEGQPLISESTRQQVLQRFFPALFRSNPQQAAPPGGPPTPPSSPR